MSLKDATHLMMYSFFVCEGNSIRVKNFAENYFNQPLTEKRLLEFARSKQQERKPYHALAFYEEALDLIEKQHGTFSSYTEEIVNEI